MRCYLMKDGHIPNVVMLNEGSDEDLIQQAEAAFQARLHQGVEGVEVWDGTRFVYRSPETRLAADSI